MSEKTTWLPLESSPETMNKLIESFGVKCVTTTDVFGLDEASLAFIPQPHLALILCFPEYKKAHELVSGSYKKLETEGYKNPEKVFFMKQNIGNACGTFALLHALANITDQIDMGGGPFFKWYKDAKGKSAAERSDCLEKDAAMAEAHDACARMGETDAEQEDIDHHFVAYVNIDDTLYELDGQFDFARPLGPTTQATLLSDAGKVVQNLFTSLGSVSFSALALFGDYA